MTCTHVLDLIDAGPLADYPGAHLDAAWAHARQCATCGPALEAAAALTAGLSALVQPTPPPRVSAAILARIARIEPVGPAPTPQAVPEKRRLVSTRDWSALATGFGGVAAALVIVMSTHLGDAVALDAAFPALRKIAPGVVTLPGTTAGALALAAGLVLYVVGMFAPLGDRRHG
jgi:hypothetical protein